MMWLECCATFMSQVSIERGNIFRRNRIFLDKVKVDIDSMLAVIFDQHEGSDVRHWREEIFLLFKTNFKTNLKHFLSTTKSSSNTSGGPDILTTATMKKKIDVKCGDKRFTNHLREEILLAWKSEIFISKVIQTRCYKKKVWTLWQSQ